VALHERFEERCLGAEGSEEGDFVDAGLDGDEPGSRAPEAVLGVDAFRGVENAVADIHRGEAKGSPDE
jgi:hypothetical protein